MTEFITRNYGNKDFEIIIKTDSKEHYKAAEEFARRLIDHAKPATDNNVGSKWIPVTERLPGFDIERVLVLMNGDMILGYPKMDTDRYVRGRWVRYGDHVTHWMPLPEPPKEVE